MSLRTAGELDLRPDAHVGGLAFEKVSREEVQRQENLQRYVATRNGQFALAIGVITSHETGAAGWLLDAPALTPGSHGA